MDLKVLDHIPPNETDGILVTAKNLMIFLLEYRNGETTE